MRDAANHDPIDSAAIGHAQRLWSYLAARRAHAPSDALVVCCSYDLRVCDYACELLRRNVAPTLVLTGKTGNWTRHLWAITEAQVFKERALANGIEPQRILLEECATNFGENIGFVRTLLPSLTRVTFITKPAAVLRVALTVPIQWPGIEFWVDSPPLRFPQDVSNVIGVLGVMHEMVGDVDRVLQYPRRGFQVAHDMPPDILTSWRALIAAGFIHHRLDPSC